MQWQCMLQGLHKTLHLAYLTWHTGSSPAPSMALTVLLLVTSGSRKYTLALGCWWRARLNGGDSWRRNLRVDQSAGGKAGRVGGG
jgi:hypothetical protein